MMAWTQRCLAVGLAIALIALFTDPAAVDASLGSPYQVPIAEGVNSGVPWSISVFHKGSSRCVASVVGTGVNARESEGCEADREEALWGLGHYIATGRARRGEGILMFFVLPRAKRLRVLVGGQWYQGVVEVLDAEEEKQARFDHGVGDALIPLDRNACVRRIIAVGGAGEVLERSPPTVCG